MPSKAILRHRSGEVMRDKRCERVAGKRGDEYAVPFPPGFPMWFCVLFCLLATTSCSLKTGMNNLRNYDQSLGVREEFFSYVEGEVYTPRIVADHADIAFGIGYNRGKKEGLIEAGEGNRRWPEAKSDMWDFHLGARVFPLGVEGRKVVPYVGGGIGYFEYDVETNVLGEYVSHHGHDHYRIDKRDDTLAHGYFNYLSVGLYVPLKKNFMLQTEFRRDFDKDHRQFDLSGYQLTVGLAIMRD